VPAVTGAASFPAFVARRVALLALARLAGERRRSLVQRRFECFQAPAFGVQFDAPLV
jgi:hypothetical protein